MSIRTIEVICVPCSKCAGLKTKINAIIKTIEIEYRTKIAYTFKHTPHLRDLGTKYSVNAIHVPFLVINGGIESGKNISHTFLKKRLVAIHRE